MTAPVSFAVDDISLKALIVGGADVNVKDKNGRRPLHRAAVNAHKVIVEVLITLYV